MNFIDTDAYYHLNIMRGIMIGEFDITPRYIYDATVAGFAKFISGGVADVSVMEYTAAIVPLVLFSLTVLMVYIIGRNVHSNMAGLIAASLLAFLPGEYWGRSLLGAVDHHVVEVFLTTFVIMCLVIAAKEKRFGHWSIISVICAGAGIFLYVTMWPGYLLFVPIFLAFAVSIRGWKPYLYITAGCVAGIIYIITYGLSFPVQHSLTLALTSEAGPGYTDYLVLMHAISAGLLLIPKTNEWYRWPFIIWSVITIGAALWQERFDYYLAVPLSLLIGIGIARLYKAFEIGKVPRKYLNAGLASILFISFCTLMLPFYPVMLNQSYCVPPEEWHDSLSWVKKHTTPGILVITWWDYGYWVEYISRREAAATPAQNVIKIQKVAKFLFTGYDDYPDNIYIIIDERTVKDCRESIRIWAGVNEGGEMFAETLYHGGLSPDYRNVYESGTVKVIHREKGFSTFIKDYDGSGG